MALKTGGSLVSSIIQKASTYDQKVIDDSIQKLSKKSAHLKGEIYELVKQEYVNFDSYVSTTVTLEQRVREVRSEYQRITKCIEQDLSAKITQSHDQKEEIESKLKITQSHIVLVQQLVDIYQAIETSRSELLSCKYVSAAEHLSNAAKSLLDLSKRGCDAQVFHALKSEQALIVSDLTIQLQEEWQKYVSWNPKLIPTEPKLEVLSFIELHISKSKDDLIGEVITAMKLLSFMGVWEQRVKLFSQKLLNFIIKPLIVHRTLKACQSTFKREIVIRMSKHADSDSKETPIADLYNMLLSVLRVVRGVVLKEYEEEWVKKVGEIICPELEELVIAHCLSTSIPRMLSELDQYETTRTKTHYFENEIVKMGFIEAGKMCKMSEYTDNVNTHFITQKSQDMLVKARSILMQPIHNTITVTEVDPIKKLNDILPVSESCTANEKDVNEDSYGVDISSLNFAFPCCAVSQSVHEFVDLLYLSLKECSLSTNPSAAVQPFHLARNMVELFCAVLSSYHSGPMTELPRVAAVQHNNFMYLAHHLITLGHQFHSRLPPPLNSQTTTFIDQVPIVRQLGEECFLAEMRKQSSCILDFLKSFGTFHEVSGDLKRDNVWQSLQGALLLVSKLSKVYLEVLPTIIHHKAIGGLLNTFVAEIIRMILSMEDIASADAAELHSLLNLIVEKGPPALLLTSEEASKESISTYCKNWNKLGELTVVMDAALLEIVELWDSGKGRLAKELSVSEVRGLIKALFKNTERRASALNKITVLHA